MNIDPEFLAVVTVVSGAIGGALVLRAKVGELGTALAEHTKADSVLQNSLIDRLARIETKLDNVIGGRDDAT